MDLDKLTYGCTSLAWVTKWLSSKINKVSLLDYAYAHLLEDAIPQGVDNLFIQDGMALLHTSPDLL